MLDFQQKRKVRSLLYHRTTLIVLGVLLLVVVRSTWIVYQKKKESEVQESISMHNVEELRTRNAELQSQIDRIQTDSGIEAEIRSKFNVAKDKENIVILLDDTATSTATSTVKTSFWSKIKNFF